MRVLFSPDLTVEDTARQRVYAALLDDPRRDWTVARLARHLLDVPVSSLRTTLLLLLGDRLMEIEEFAREPALTLRMTGDGEQVLAEILGRWRIADAGENLSAVRAGQHAS